MPFLSRTMDRPGPEVALVSPEGTLTYPALDRISEKTARQLVTLGVRPGDVVALKGNPDQGTLGALHGIWKAGGVPFPMNPRWPPAEEERVLGRLSPRLALLGEGMPPMQAVSENLGLGGGDGLPVDPLEGVWPDTNPLPGGIHPEAVPDSTPAAHLLTSGTSGEARTVVLTFGNLRASARGARERLSLDPSDRWLVSLSLAHVGGLALVSRAALLGSSLVLTGAFQPLRLPDLIRDGEVTHASLVPTMLHQLLELWGGKGVPDSLRCLLIGGAHAKTELLEEALALGLPLALTYGLTEATSQVATAPPGLVASKPGTVGRPLPGVDLRISGTGEILVRGPTVAPGLEAEDGWLHTGDLGHVDGEGDLWVTGRLIHRIISGGVNVDPAEVEAVLRTHPGLEEVAVVGVPDPKWGERVVAALVPDGKTEDLPHQLDRIAKAVLSPAKRPRDYRFLEALPRNVNGKVDRARIRSLFL